MMSAKKKSRPKKPQKPTTKKAPTTSSPTKSPTKSAKKSSNKKRTKTHTNKIKQSSLSFNYIVILFIIRLTSALFNPISDCDETYNYWEPTSFLLTKYGFQTWEYAPQYALRSYSYLLPQYFIGSLLTSLNNQILIFYGIRIFLCIICLLCELYFVKSLTEWFGHKTVFITFLFMTFSSGMFNCCAAYLPQQFVLCMILLSFGSFFRHYRILAILFMGIAVIFGWPFIGLLAIPMAIDCIIYLGLTVFIIYISVFGSILCGLCIGIDYIYYNKLVLAPLNIFLYNLSVTGPNVSDYKSDDDMDDMELEGQNLYGVDDWTFYVKNLLFNWNIVFILAIFAPIASNLLILLFFNKKKKSKNRGRRARGIGCCKGFMNLFKMGSDNNSAIVGRLMHCMLPLWIWYLFFTYMPHKEERFMFVIYPFIALNAALTLTQFRLCKIDENGKIFTFNVTKCIGFIRFIVVNINFAVTMIFIGLSVSRSVGQVVYYRAPLNIWYKSGEYIRLNDIGGDRANICVGMEWYRIPSSLFISDVANIKWIESGFDGELPIEFEGTDFVNKPFNDKNKMEKSRFVINVEGVCDYIIDLWESNKVIKEYDVSKYKVIEKVKFLDREATSSGIFRSLYIPYWSNKNVVYANYVFLKRKKVVESGKK
eukprot:169646_1